jgi:hypothetical protein
MCLHPRNTYEMEPTGGAGGKGEGLRQRPNKTDQTSEHRLFPSSRRPRPITGTIGTAVPTLHDPTKLSV